MIDQDNPICKYVQIMDKLVYSNILKMNWMFYLFCGNVSQIEHLNWQKTSKFTDNINDQLIHYNI